MDGDRPMPDLDHEEHGCSVFGVRVSHTACDLFF